MSTPTSGYIFISTDHYTSRMALINDVITSLGGKQQIKGISVPYSTVQGLSTEETLEQVSQAQSGGSIRFHIAEFGATIWFNGPTSGYHVLNPDITRAQFREPDNDPMRVELFAQLWTQLCEALHADFATFTADMHEPDEYYQTKLKALQEDDIENLLFADDWLTYLSPAIAQRHQVSILEYVSINSYEYRLMEELPSGAFVLHAGKGYNPELGNKDLEFHAEYLISQLEPHTNIPGVDRLLTALREERTGRIERLYGDHDRKVDGFYKALEQGYKDSRSHLNAIRALWASARQRPGLVAVEVPFPLKHEDGSEDEVIVPIVAAGGREWLLASMQPPFSTTDHAWSDPQLGLLPRLQTLLALAQQHPLDGEPPTLIVVFWKGVSPEVRAALASLHVHSELTASSLPLLQTIL